LQLREVAKLRRDGAHELIRVNVPKNSERMRTYDDSTKMYSKPGEIVEYFEGSIDEEDRTSTI